jgi:hypothetical protein
MRCSDILASVDGNQGLLEQPGLTAQPHELHADLADTGPCRGGSRRSSRSLVPAVALATSVRRCAGSLARVGGSTAHGSSYRSGGVLFSTSGTLQGLSHETKLHRSHAVVVGLASSAPRAQAADESGFVLGTRLGVARYPAAQTLVFGTQREDLHGGRNGHVNVAWAIDAGYRFNRYFALQASYVDLGEASGSVRNEDSSVVVQTTSAAEGAALILIGSWPLDRWQLYAVVGVFVNDTSSSVSGEVQGTPFFERASGEDEDTILGAGVVRMGCCDLSFHTASTRSGHAALYFPLKADTLGRTL